MLVGQKVLDKAVLDDGNDRIELFLDLQFA